MKKILLFLLATVLLAVAGGGWWAYRNVLGSKLEPGYQTILNDKQINVLANYSGRATSKGLYLTRSGDETKFIDIFTIIGPSTFPAGSTQASLDMARQQVASKSKQAGYFKSTSVETLSNGDSLFILEEEGELDGATHRLGGDITTSTLTKQYFFSAQSDGKDDWPKRKEEFLKLLRSIQNAQ